MLVISIILNIIFIIIILFARISFRSDNEYLDYRIDVLRRQSRERSYKIMDLDNKIGILKEKLKQISEISKE